MYHVHNRSINRQVLFFSDDDYLDFLSRIRTHISPRCDILAWCLMPNNFHLLIHSTRASVVSKKIGGNKMPELSFGIKQLLSSYAKFLNKKIKRTGNLFQQKTKAELATDAISVFHYIHQQPWRAGLVQRIENWKFSSFPDYVQLRNGSLVNKDLAAKLLDLKSVNLLDESYRTIPTSVLKLLDKPR